MIIERQWEDGQFFQLCPNKSKQIYEDLACHVEQDADYVLMKLEEAVLAYEGHNLPMLNENGQKVLHGCSRYPRQAAEYWAHRGNGVREFIMNLPKYEDYYEIFCVKFHELKRRAGL